MHCLAFGALFSLAPAELELIGAFQSETPFEAMGVELRLQQELILLLPARTQDQRIVRLFHSYLARADLTIKSYDKFGIDPTAKNQISCRERGSR